MKPAGNSLKIYAKNLFNQVILLVQLFYPTQILKLMPMTFSKKNPAELNTRIQNIYSVAGNSLNTIFSKIINEEKISA